MSRAARAIIRVLVAEHGPEAVVRWAEGMAARHVRESVG